MVTVSPNRWQAQTPNKWEIDQAWAKKVNTNTGTQIRLFKTCAESWRVYRLIFNTELSAVLVCLVSFNVHNIQGFWKKLKHLSYTRGVCRLSIMHFGQLLLLWWLGFDGHVVPLLSRMELNIYSQKHATPTWHVILGISSPKQYCMHCDTAKLQK